MEPIPHFRCLILPKFEEDIYCVDGERFSVTGWQNPGAISWPSNFHFFDVHLGSVVHHHRLHHKLNKVFSQSFVKFSWKLKIMNDHAFCWNKRAMMALGRSPEYHWNQIISKSVHRFSRRSLLKLFLFIALAAILFNRAEPFEQFLKTVI